jgi:Sulfatase
VRERAAHLLGLWAVAVAQPLFDLLGRNPEFFAAHGAGRVEIVVFALALILVPPALLVGVELAAGTISNRATGGLHLGFVAALAGLVALQVAKRLDVSDAIVLTFAGVAAVAAVLVYAALAPFRAFLTVLAAAPVAFLGLFLAASPTARLVWEGEARAQVAPIAPARTPVVLLVLDELPLNSILDAEGRVDAVRYPGFGELAREADWFPNATAAHEGTLWAVPAILTGRVPRPDRLPRFEDHPRNLFTLLGRRYRIEASEQSTTLCPPSLCRDRAGPVGRLRSLTEDSGVVYLHTALPRTLAQRLPPVTEGWGGFLTGSDAEPARFDRFVSELEPSTDPTLHYGHFLLPHSPWRHLPSGESYDLRPPAVLWSRDEIWANDAGLVVQSFQRHLLQTAYVDSLVGRLLRRLRSSGLYDRCLLVVVADHGISFRSGGKRRPVSRANLADIAFVPLFVKRPGQRAGRVLPRHVRTVDLLPTIADVLGIDVGWPFDGRSAYAAGAGPARVAVRKDAGDELSASLTEAVRERRAALARQIALFGSRTPPSQLFAVGPHRDRLRRRAPPGGRALLEFAQRASPGLVALGGRASTEAVAVMSGGATVAVAPVYDGRFWVLAPTTRDDVRVVEIR